jgi:hypothetical protein
VVSFRLNDRQEKLICRRLEANEEKWKGWLAQEQENVMEENEGSNSVQIVEVLEQVKSVIAEIQSEHKTSWDMINRVATENQALLQR